MNSVGDAFGEHEDGAVDVGADAVWHNRSIYDAQVLEAVDGASLVDDGERIGRWTHFTGAGNVVAGCGVAGDPGVQGIVFEVGSAGFERVGDDGFECGVFGEGAAKVDGFADAAAIFRMIEEVEVQ